jgi:hypothetical protein
MLVVKSTRLQHPKYSHRKVKNQAQINNRKKKLKSQLIWTSNVSTRLDPLEFFLADYRCVVRLETLKLNSSIGVEIQTW